MLYANEEQLPELWPDTRPRCFFAFVYNVGRVNDRKLLLRVSARELPNEPDNPVPARVRAPLAAIRETRLARYPLFRADSIRSACACSHADR